MRDVSPGERNDPTGIEKLKAMICENGKMKGDYMKTECDIVKDLLPLYVEKIASEASNRAVEEHLQECEQCSKIYQEMKTSDLNVQYDRKPAESFQKYVKKEKRKFEIKAAVITAAVILLIVVIRLVEMGSLIAFLALEGVKAKVYEDADVSHYSWYMGKDAKEEYVRKWGMDESIFPKEISREMNVTDYKMVYYDPWDAQYLSYLVVEYEEESYAAETERLREYDSKEYQGYFGATGFQEEYTLLAMEADPYYGLIYALAGENRQIVYVELIFCNYFMDIDYKTMINEHYLPVGFDATSGNAYRQQRLGHE